MLELIAADRTHLWNWFRQCSAFCGLIGKESPLLTHTETMVSCQTVPDFFPDSLPASCSALAPFRLCSCSQPQSSPWDPTSEARASAPSPCPPRWVSRQASRAGECWLAPILCAGISPLCPLHPCRCTLLHGSEASPVPPAVSALEGASYCVETFPPSQLPPRGAGPILMLLSPFFLFSFALPRYVGIFLPFGRSEVFCQRSVGVL